MCKRSEGFVLQELQERERHLSSEAQYRAVLPLLVTTAPLSICEVDAKSIDLTSGNLNGIARTTDVDWLVLSFPFTPSVALGGERLWVGPEGMHTRTSAVFC